MATYDFSKTITFENAGTGGQYGYVNGFPVLRADIADSVLAANGGYVSGDAAGKADNAMGWDTGSVQGTLANGAGVFGIKKDMQTDTEGQPTGQFNYSGDMNAAAKALNLNLTGMSEEQKYNAINNAAKDLYLVSGKTGYQAGGVGETKNGMLQTAAIPGATTNHATVLYRKEGDALVPLSETAQYFNGEMELSPGSGLSDFLQVAAPIAGIALIATGAGAGLGTSLLSGAGITGVSTATAGALGGAVIGGGVSAATGGNVLQGAALGGLGGYAQAGGFNGIGNTLSNTFSEITGLDTSTISNAFGSTQTITDNQYLADTAKSLVSSTGGDLNAVAQNLEAMGVDPFVAADIAQQAGYGASASQLASYLNTAYGAGASTLSGAGTLTNTGVTSALGNTATQTAGNQLTNNLTNTGIRAAVGSLLGDAAQQLPGAVAGLYGANADRQAYEEYANKLTSQTNAYNQALQDQVAGFAGNVTGAAGSAGNMLTGTARTQAGNLTNAVGGFTGQATNVAEQQTNALTSLAGQLAPTMQFNPVAMTTRFGSTTTPQYDANGKLIGYGYNVASDIAAQRDRLLSLSNQALPTTTDIGQATTNYYNELQALQNPQREQQLAALRAQLQTTGRGGLAFGATSGTGGANALAATNPELAAYYNALAQQQSAQALTAQDIAQQRLNQQLALSQGLFGQAQTLEGAGQQAMTLGANLGQTAQQAAAQAAQTQLQAQQAAMAQRISAQLQAAGLDAAAATNAAQLQVQSATSAAQMQVQAAINAANLQAAAAQQAATSNISSAQLGAKLQATGQLGYNAAVQQGLSGITPGLGGLLSSGVNTLLGNTGSSGLFNWSNVTPATYGYNQYNPDFGGFDLNSTTTPGLWQDLSFA